MFVTRNRKLNRWSNHDYSQPGSYFITFCTQNRTQWFGEIRNGRMRLNEWGLIAHTQWQSISKYYPFIIVDQFMIMPDHIHGILIIRDQPVGTGYYPVPTTASNQKNGRDDRYDTISKIIKSYKHAVTKRIRFIEEFQFSWQRSFHDRIIRDEKELQAIRQYILSNPKNWKEDNDDYI